MHDLPFDPDQIVCFDCSYIENDDRNCPRRDDEIIDMTSHTRSIWGRVGHRGGEGDLFVDWGRAGRLREEGGKLYIIRFLVVSCA